MYNSQFLYFSLVITTIWIEKSFCSIDQNENSTAVNYETYLNANTSDDDINNDMENNYDDDLENELNDSGESYIINGEKVKSISQYPFFAQQYIFFSYVNRCGGSIISQRHVITAKHCLYSPLWMVSFYVGSVKSLQGQRYYVSEVLSFRNSDVAIYVLNRPISFGKNVRRISIAPYVVQPETTVTTLGFGLTEKNKQPSQLLKLTMITLEQCVLGDRFICATALDNKTVGNVCYGDSGGPLIDSNGTLVGIVTGASLITATADNDEKAAANYWKKNEDCYFYDKAIFTKISDFYDEIYNIIKN